ncbi:MAG: metallophosphoesterase [Methanomassiliicoccales archaeon]
MRVSAFPVIDRPLLRVDGREEMLVAGDLHVGIEAEYAERGVHLPSQTFRMERELSEFAGERRLILLGDIKHQVPGSSPQEHAELPRTLRSLAREFKGVDVVKGNHDAGLEEFLPGGIKVHPSQGFSVGEVGFIHGHTWPSDEVMSRPLLVMAHNHPAIAFKDGLGRVTTEPCWLRCVTTPEASRRYLEVPEEVIVVPALNRSIGGSPVNQVDRRLLGPLFSNGLIDLENAQAYLLDGIHLGRVKHLMVQRSK